MRFLDISWPISNEITTYKNKKDVKIEFVKNFEQDLVRESKICLGSHTGTHLDLPAHFLKDGFFSQDLILSQINGKCQVLDLSHINNRITDKDLMQHDIKSDIILLKTKNSLLDNNFDFNFDFVYLDKSGSKYIADNFKLKLVGIDYLGIEHTQADHETHITLFNSNILILEGLRLKNASAGFYTLNCLPLNIVGLEALPCRAVLYV